MSVPQSISSRCSELGVQADGLDPFFVGPWSVVGKQRANDVVHDTEFYLRFICDLLLHCVDLCERMVVLMEGQVMSFSSLMMDEFIGACVDAVDSFYVDGKKVDVRVLEEAIVRLDCLMLRVEEIKRICEELENG